MYLGSETASVTCCLNNPGFLQIVIGGTNQKTEMQRIRNHPPQILVATPGRCLDHLTSNSPLNVSCLPYFPSEMKSLVAERQIFCICLSFPFGALAGCGSFSNLSVVLGLTHC